MDMEQFGTLENMELAEWLESVLKKYCQGLAERQTIPPPPRKSNKIKSKKIKQKTLNNKYFSAREWVRERRRTYDGWELPKFRFG